MLKLVRRLFHIANAQLFKDALHDVPAMAVAIHPTIDHSPRRLGPGGDVFTHCTKFVPCGTDPYVGALPIRVQVVEEVSLNHVQGVTPGRAAQEGMSLEWSSRRKLTAGPAIIALGSSKIGFFEDLVLKGYPFIRPIGVQHIARGRWGQHVGSHGATAVGQAH